MAQTSIKLRGRLTARQYVEGILSGNRVALARAITLTESDLPDDADLAAEVLDAVLPYSEKPVESASQACRGREEHVHRHSRHPPHRERREKLAVLSVDPSSPLSGGSILGDKTRMERLSVEENAFIRPSPARGHLGGVARRTRETMVLCEAAGYDNIFVETVGVGQSETAVSSMTDFFLLLMFPAPATNSKVSSAASSR